MLPTTFWVMSTRFEKGNTVRKPKHANDASTICGCNCSEGRDRMELRDGSDGHGWRLCDCSSCGPFNVQTRQRQCMVMCSPICSFIAWIERGKSLAATYEQIEGSPRFCEDCKEHGLLAMRQAAVRRQREQRKRQHECFTDMGCKVQRRT